MPGQDKQATLEQTKRYMKDGLETVTTKMGLAATALSQTLEAHAFEFERLDAWVRSDPPLPSQMHEQGKCLAVPDRPLDYVGALCCGVS